MHIHQEQINAALARVIDPNTGRNLVESKNIERIDIKNDLVSVDVVLGYPARSQFEALRMSVSNALLAIPGIRNTEVTVSHRIAPHTVQHNIQLLPGVKNIIAVASGKGGVGKSTTAVNLALALAAEGAQVGLLDADIYGPSQPMMLGIHHQPESNQAQMMEPIEAHGIQANSIGFLIEPDSPMVWRGPMVTSALNQLLRQTNWRDLDYLIVDMPPGTGDIQLTLAQRVPVTGAVIVTTPQDIALLDAKKGLRMFEKVGIPILGLVENMSQHICSNCGHITPLFGEGGGAKMAEQYGVELLGSLPLDATIREHTDAGKPIVITQPDGSIANIYRAIARKVALRIADKKVDMRGKFPAIVVQNT